MLRQMTIIQRYEHLIMVAFNHKQWKDLSIEEKAILNHLHGTSDFWHLHFEDGVISFRSENDYLIFDAKE